MLWLTDGFQSLLDGELRIRYFEDCRQAIVGLTHHNALSTRRPLSVATVRPSNVLLFLLYDIQHSQRGIGFSPEWKPRLKR